MREPEIIDVTLLDPPDTQSAVHAMLRKAEELDVQGAVGAMFVYMGTLGSGSIRGITIHETTTTKGNDPPDRTRSYICAPHSPSSLVQEMLDVMSRSLTPSRSPRGGLIIEIGQGQFVATAFFGNGFFDLDKQVAIAREGLKAMDVPETDIDDLIKTYELPFP